MLESHTRKLRYRLALDLGTNSLGWAMLRLRRNANDDGEEAYAIIKVGVRIFSDGRNPKDGTSLAVARRNARGMRRRRDRLVQRKEKLFEALVRHGFFPADKAKCKELETLNPYLLRSEGISRALSGAEFARALFHLNQRRGFKSNRRTDKKDNDASTMKTAISNVRKELSESGFLTLGQWLYQRQLDKKSLRARLRGVKVSEKAYDFYTDRAMTEHEFDQLWQVQTGFNPALFNAVAGQELKDILLFQRNLRPVKPGRCTLLPDEPRAALALPSTQQFRIYQELANLRLLDEQLQETPLSREQRDTVATLLERGTLTFNAMRKALKLPGWQKFNLEDAKRDRLKGNATAMVLAKAEHFGAAWHAFGLGKQDEIVEKLLTEADEAVLLVWLQAECKISEETAEAIANVGLPAGYGSLSSAALARILPHLKGEKIVTYDEAVKLGEFESHSLLSFAQKNGERAELPYYGEVLQRHVGFEKPNPRNEEETHGKIANPTVHIGLNQVRSLVNALITQYGKPIEVVIEVARELKLSRERQLEIAKEQAENQKRNDDFVAQACVVLGEDPHNLDKNKRRKLSQKMQLWRELNVGNVLERRCPYSGEAISIERLINGDVEIEHIFPFGRSLDDSMANKTVAIREANRLKENFTPWEAFGKRKVAGYDYEGILQRASLMPINKRKRFAQDAEHDDAKFLARALNDTAYLSKITVEYLSCLYPPKTVKVRALPGKITAMIRGKLGLNFMLGKDGDKNREDHRHHALDAIVIGLTDQSLMQTFADASKTARQQDRDRVMGDVSKPWDNFYQHVDRALAAIYVSHKPEHGYQGAMLEDTAWGILPEGQARRRERPADGGARVSVVKNLALIKISAKNQHARHGVDSDGKPKAYKGYVGGSNYCMEIWRDEKGQWQGDIVSTFAAYQIVRELGEEEGFKRLRNPILAQNGRPLVMRLCKKDYVRLVVDGKLRTTQIAKISGNGQIFMADHNEGNVDARNRDPKNIFSYISKYPGSLQKAQGRRCVVTISGQLRDPGFKG